MENNFGFVPTSAVPNQAGSAPVSTPSPVDSFGFVPTDGGSTGNVPTPTPEPASTGFMQTAATGVVNALNNNPISRGLTSLSALPLQLGVKGYNAVTGSHVPDPYAGGIGAGTGPFANIGVTSSDQAPGQFAKEEIGNAGTVGSLFLPIGRVAKTGGSALASFAPQVLKGTVAGVGRIGTQAAFGALQGVFGGLQQGQTSSQLKDSAKTGALVTGSLASAGEFGSALLSSLAKTTGASRLVAQKDNLKTLQNAFNNASTKTTNPIQTMEQNGLIKGLRVIDGKISVEGVTNPSGTGNLDNLIHGQQEMGTQAVSTMKGGVPTKDFKNAVIASIKGNAALKATGKVGKVMDEIGRRFDDYLASYGDTVPYKDVNSIRIAMNKMWDPETWDAEKAIGNAARHVLYDGSGSGKALKSAMANEQELINAKEFVQRLGGTAVKGGRLGKYIAAGAGSVIGGIAGAPLPVVGPSIGGFLGGAATQKAVELSQKNYFTPLLSGIAQGIKNTATSPIAKGIQKIGQAALIPSLVQK